MLVNCRGWKLTEGRSGGREGGHRWRNGRRREEGMREGERRTSLSDLVTRDSFYCWSPLNSLLFIVPRQTYQAKRV